MIKINKCLTLLEPVTHKFPCRTFCTNNGLPHYDIFGAKKPTFRNRLIPPSSTLKSCTLKTAKAGSFKKHLGLHSAVTQTTSTSHLLPHSLCLYTLNAKLTKILPNQIRPTTVQNTQNIQPLYLVMQKVHYLQRQVK